MADLIYETTPPLAWDDESQPFQVPEEAIAWKTRRYNGKPGRPPAVWTKDGPLHLELSATMERFREAVENKPGSYRLYPVDRFGRELEPIAVIEVVPDENAPAQNGTQSLALANAGGPGVMGGEPHGRLVAELPHRFFDLYERMLTSRDANDALMAQLLTTLVTTTAAIQQGTASLLGTANTTVKVANGVEALERIPAPQLEIAALTDKLAMLGELKETLATLGDGDKSETPWFVQLLNGPLGMGLMSFANNFAQTIAKAQAQTRATATPAESTTVSDTRTDDDD
jgi:hypothetical protein